MSKPKPKMQRKAFVLIEVLIATTLFIMLLAAIFGIFWRTSKINQSISQIRTANEEMLLTQSRLQGLFSNIVFQERHRPYFFVESNKYASSPSLVFTFENQFHTNYAFSNVVLGKLYVEESKLCLAIFPHPKNADGPPKEMRKEQLLAGVKEIDFSFFLAPVDKDEEQEKEEDEGDKKKKKPHHSEWLNDWLKDYERPPTLVKLKVLKTNGELYLFWFFLPNEIGPILYEKR